jgi:hypothetical protein
MVLLGDDLHGEELTKYQLYDLKRIHEMLNLQERLQHEMK